MQGLWKTKLSGYDRKSNKRKKMSFNHFLKDNKNSFFKNNNTNEVVYENIIVKDMDSGFEINFEKTPLYLIEITYNINKEEMTKELEVFYLYSSKNGLKYDLIIVFDKATNSYVELIDFLKIKRGGDFYSSSIYIISFKILKEISYLDLIKKLNLTNIKYIKNNMNDNSKKVFFYKKQIQKYVLKKVINSKDYHYEESLTNKDLQNFSNKERRNLEKKYINKNKWEDESSLPFKNRYGWWS